MLRRLTRLSEVSMESVEDKMRSRMDCYLVSARSLESRRLLELAQNQNLGTRRRSEIGARDVRST